MRVRQRQLPSRSTLHDILAQHALRLDVIPDQPRSEVDRPYGCPPASYYYLLAPHFETRVAFHLPCYPRPEVGPHVMLSHHPRFAVDINNTPHLPACYRPHSAVDRRTEFGWLLIAITLTPRAIGHRSPSSQRRPHSTATPLTVACARATPRCHTHPRHSSTEQRRGRPRPAVPAHSLHCSMTSIPSVCRNRVSITNAPPTTTIIDMQQQGTTRLEEIAIISTSRLRNCRPSSCSRGGFWSFLDRDRPSPPGSPSCRP